MRYGITVLPSACAGPLVDVLVAAILADRVALRRGLRRITVHPSDWERLGCAPLVLVSNGCSVVLDPDGRRPGSARHYYGGQRPKSRKRHQAGTSGETTFDELFSRPLTRRQREVVLALVADPRGVPTRAELVARFPGLKTRQAMTKRLQGARRRVKPQYLERFDRAVQRKPRRKVRPMQLAELEGV